MRDDKMGLAEKAAIARENYESVKIDYSAANAAVESVKREIIEACQDVNKHWRIVTLASRIVEKETAADLQWRRFNFYGVQCDLAEDAARKEADATDIASVDCGSPLGIPRLQGAPRRKSLRA
jgi:hypothetical protein